MQIIAPKPASQQASLNSKIGVHPTSRTKLRHANAQPQLEPYKPVRQDEDDGIAR